MHFFKKKYSYNKSVSLFQYTKMNVPNYRISLVEKSLPHVLMEVWMLTATSSFTVLHWYLQRERKEYWSECKIFTNQPDIKKAIVSEIIILLENGGTFAGGDSERAHTLQTLFTLDYRVLIRSKLINEVSSGPQCP